MKGMLNLFVNFLSEYYPEVDRVKIIEGIKNPARNPWIIKELNGIFQLFNKSVEDSPDPYLLNIREIIEDVLINAVIICQNSKCEPFKFVNFKSK